MGLTTYSPGTVQVQAPWALKDLPAYRPVARKLMRLTARQDVQLEQIQQVLRMDAAFTADVLRLANSPLIGMRGEIKSVMQAVMMLGLERIKSLAATLSLRAFLTAAVPRGALLASWRHNLATALLSERLARILVIDNDTCYTAGLVHDIGRLALLSAFPEKYERILSVQPSDDFDLLQCEKSIFDIDHCQAGKWILEQWDFPEELREVAFLHHQKPQPDTSVLLRIVHVGWQMADLLGFSVLSQPVAGQIDEIVSVLPAKAQQQVLAEFDRLAEDVAFKINAIDCSLI
jgi:putative nucleotidyltransferase with HDIG domain